MTSAEQSGEPLRDFSSPATWGDVEQVRLSLGAKIETEIAGVRTEMADIRTEIAGVRAEGADIRTEMARMETRLIRWFAGATGASVGVIGVLFGIFQAVD